MCDQLCLLLGIFFWKQLLKLLCVTNEVIVKLGKYFHVIAQSMFA